MISRVHINMVFSGNFASEWQHGMKYHDTKLGISQEIITNKKEDGSFCKSQHYFFIDDDEREFRDLDALVEAYNEKFNFSEETPTHQIKYVKIITKRNPSVEGV